MTEPISVLLVDDHAVVRAGYRRVLDNVAHIEVVGEAETGEEAYRLYKQLKPDVTVMDLSMPGMGGLGAVHRIRAHNPKAKIIIFTIHINPMLARRAIEAGALGYITKDCSPEVLVSAVEEAARGNNFLGPKIAQKVVEQSTKPHHDLLVGLSPREFEVFQLLVNGHTTAEIADVLYLSNKTVANHVTQIKVKLNVSTSAEMVHLALQSEIIK